MNKINNGGPAFPAIIPIEHSDIQGKDYLNYSEAGMTLRDYFAAMALQGLLSKPSVNLSGNYAIPIAARNAYEYADAMIIERNK